jgi:hypothetical protein
MKALSIRQPWAWLIVNGFKDIENRGWWTYFRGQFLIHASSTMTWEEYDICCRFAAERGVYTPRQSQILRGGIVGYATLTDCVRKHSSPWFEGPFGFVVEGAGKLPFVKCAGQLQFFNVPYTVEGLLAQGEEQANVLFDH